MILYLFFFVLETIDTQGLYCDMCIADDCIAIYRYVGYIAHP